MLLGDYYVHDPRVTLVPIEHLTRTGVTAELAELLRQRCGWSAAKVELFDTAFALYWERSSALAQRTRTWPAPRLRHVAVVGDGDDVRPYAQMLNTSAWTLYACDLEPSLSHAELAAYLLVLGDQMSVTGEVTMAAVRAAPWWFGRSEGECAAFAAAARASLRPDAAGVRAVAEALPWLRQLRHETLRPPGLRPGIEVATAPAQRPRSKPSHRPIPGTGLLVPAALEQDPPALVESWTRTARASVAAYEARWKAPDRAAQDELLRWLEHDAPPLLITGRSEAVLWQPENPDRLGLLRQELRGASGAGVRDIDADLRLVADKTRSFRASLSQPAALPLPHGEPEQHGYAYLHRTRNLIAYNLHEAGIERLRGPALPYARAMLGARAIHEWCHLAVDAGWVPARVGEAELRGSVSAVGELLDAVVREAPAAVRAAAEPELRALGARPGTALAEGMLGRFVDYRANLLAQRFLDRAEQETYVRQNVRTLRGAYPPAAVFQMLARYLYEFQYLRFSQVADRRTFFLRSTWFDDDFFRPRILGEAQFDALTAAVAEVAGAYAVEERWFRM